MFNMRTIATLALLMIASVGCGPSNEYQPGLPQTVTVAKPIQRAVTLYLEETGTTEAVQMVDVRARVRTEARSEPESGSLMPMTK